MRRVPHDLAALMRALAALDRGELLALSAARPARDAEARAAAWSAVHATAARLALTDPLRDIERDIVRWADTDGARSGVYTVASPGGDLLLADLRRQATPALVDAAAALLVGDALDPVSRQVLLRPWRHLGRR